MKSLFPVLALLAVGCKAPTPIFLGEEMLAYFPFAENLDCRWEFVNEDTLIPYKLIAEIANEEIVGDTRQYTVEYFKDCVGEDPTCVDDDFVRDMTWSVQGNQGVHIHRAEVESGETVFEPSLRFVERHMSRGGSSTAESNGVTYTTTLNGFVDCPTALAWEGCAELALTSGSGSDIVTGTYWAINDFNIVAMDWDDDDVGTWRLVNHFTVE